MKDEFSTLLNYDPLFAITPFRNIHFNSSDGRQATIDFGGEAIKYSGDLPVEESAKMFFDAVFRLYKLELKP